MNLLTKKQSKKEKYKDISKSTRKSLVSGWHKGITFAALHSLQVC